VVVLDRCQLPPCDDYGHTTPSPADAKIVWFYAHGDLARQIVNASLIATAR